MSLACVKDESSNYQGFHMQKEGAEDWAGFMEEKKGYVSQSFPVNGGFLRFLKAGH